MPYLGNAPSAAFQSVAYQDLTGGTGTSFTLSHAVSSAQEIEVFVNNVRQEPTVAYSAVGTTLTMTGTIAATDDFYVVFQGKAVGSVSHPTTSPLAATTGNFTGAVTATSFSGDGSALTGVSAGKVLQVVSTNKTDTFSTTSTSFVDVTGLSVQITPSATSNKILVTGALVCSASVHFVFARLMRDGTQVLVPDSTGNRSTANFGFSTYQASTYMNGTLPIHALDSPSSTSALTYKIQIEAASGTSYVNRTDRDTDNTGGYDMRGVSTITAIEIEG